MIDFHCGRNFVTGPTGIELFFPLSGFLITFLLIKEFYKTGTFSFYGFMLRRIFRLYPAMIVLLLGCLLYYGINHIRIPRNYALASFSILGGGMNWVKLYGPSIPADLRHLWSLSVDMQFYVVWSLLAFLLLRVTNSLKILAGIASILIVAVISWRYIFLEAGGKWPRLYFGTDTTIDSFLVGSVLACIVLSDKKIRSQIILNIIFLAGFTAHVYYMGWAPIKEWGKSPVYPTLMALSTAAILYPCCVSTKSLARWAFDWKALRYLGVISYGAFLWHYPILHWIKPLRLTGSEKMFAVFLMAMAAAAVSYAVIEKPAVDFGKKLLKKRQ